MSWSPYPSEPRQRRSTITRDVLAILAVVLLAWLGRRVYQLVDNLRAVTDAVNNAGSSVQQGFQTAADAVSGTPLIGDDIAGALQSAGGTSGGNIVELALTGDTAIHRLALALGLLTFLIPTLILLLLYVPMRVGLDSASAGLPAGLPRRVQPRTPTSASDACRHVAPGGPPTEVQPRPDWRPRSWRARRPCGRPAL